jgi:hypothetical protein
MHNMRRFVIVVLLASAALYGQPSPALKQIAAISLGSVTGRIDHLAYDPTRQHLFVAALGNDTVEVIDTAKAGLIRSLTGFHKPQGIAYVADANAVAVANGDTGTLELLDAETPEKRWTVKVADDADNVRYDVAAKRIYVAAVGGLFAFDPTSGKALGRIPIDGHPESFQLETSGTRVYANLPGLMSSQIVGADRRTMAADARSAPGCGGNYPMALDEGTSRLFVGCRRPAQLAVVDVHTGKPVASVDIVGDTDDLFYDADRRRVYVIGGDGFVDVFERQGDVLRRIDRVATRPGARTGLWVPAISRLFVAVPARGGEQAEIRVLAPNS